MEKYDSTPLDSSPYEPLINYGESVQYCKPKRQSNMVAAYRIFAVVVTVGFVAGLYWRLS